jgi:hypothetical protein
MGNKSQRPFRVFLFKFGNLKSNNSPSEFQINPKIFMNENISHSGDRTPAQSRGLGARKMTWKLFKTIRSFIDMLLSIQKEEQI